MAHFYGTVRGGRGESTKCGTKSSGMIATAAGWGGCVRVYVTHDAETGTDRFEVRQDRWKGEGVSEILAVGTVGQPSNSTPVKDASQSELDSLPPLDSNHRVIPS